MDRYHMNRALYFRGHKEDEDQEKGSVRLSLMAGEKFTQRGVDGIPMLQEDKLQMGRKEIQ